MGVTLVLCFQRPPKEPHVEFIRYVTNSTEGRVAIFSFTNVHERAIGFRVVTEAKAASGWPAFVSGNTLPHQPPDLPIEPGSNSVFAVSVPTSNATWRVWMLYSKKTTKRDDVKFNVRQFFYRIHMNVIGDRIECEKYRSYSVYGPEMHD
jgi:hypothetical protein